jgi:hypothetical protein
MPSGVARNFSLVPPALSPRRCAVTRSARCWRWEPSQAVGHLLAPLTRPIAPGLDLLARPLQLRTAWSGSPSVRGRIRQLRQATPRLLMR